MTLKPKTPICTVCGCPLDYIDGEPVCNWCPTGYDEGGLPIHLPITVTENGQGPCDDGDPEAHHTECWCMDKNCTKFYGVPPNQCPTCYRIRRMTG